MTDVTVPLGQTARVLELSYTTLNPDKPFVEATLTFHDNGSYRIVSAGEDHFGSWVSLDARTVVFLSWPSPDWDDDVAMHTLAFADDGTFTQELVRQGGTASRQDGTWSETPLP